MSDPFGGSFGPAWGGSFGAQITATLNATQADNSIAATAGVPVQGRLNSTQAGNTVVSAAAVTVDAQLQKAQAPNSVASTATVSVSAALDKAQAPNSLAARAAVAVTAALASEQAPNTLTARATTQPVIRATLDKTQAGNTLASTAIVVWQEEVGGYTPPDERKRKKPAPWGWKFPMWAKDRRPAKVAQATVRARQDGNTCAARALVVSPAAPIAIQPAPFVSEIVTVVAIPPAKEPTAAIPALGFGRRYGTPKPVVAKGRARIQQAPNGAVASASVHGLSDEEQLILLLVA